MVNSVILPPGIKCDARNGLLAVAIIGEVLQGDIDFFLISCQLWLLLEQRSDKKCAYFDCRWSVFWMECAVHHD